MDRCLFDFIPRASIWHVNPWPAFYSALHGTAMQQHPAMMRHAVQP
jgi:hypothetical protein